MKIVMQVYSATVRLHTEYASNTWLTAAKANLDYLARAQILGLRLITGGMKTKPISEMERTASPMSLEERREEKVLRKSQKVKRLLSGPLHDQLETSIKNTLTRQSQTT